MNFIKKPPVYMLSTCSHHLYSIIPPNYNISMEWARELSGLSQGWVPLGTLLMKGLTYQNSLIFFKIFQEISNQLVGQ